MKDFLLNFYNNWFIIAIYTIILLIIGIIRFRKNDREHSIFTGVNLFIMFYYVFIAIGPIYLVLFKNYQYNYNIFFILLAGLICFIFGSNFIVKNRTINLKIKNKFPKLKDIEFNKIKKNAIIVLIVSYICALIYLGSKIEFIFQDLENNRVLAMQGSGVIIHFAYAMIPATWILYYCNFNMKRDYKIYIAFFVDIIFLMLMGFRARILELLLVAIIIRNFYKPLKIKKLMIVGTALIVLVSILQIVRILISGGQLKSGIDSLINTIAVGSINLKHIFSAFPSRVPFQYGYTYWLGINILLPTTSMDATLWLKEVLGLSFAGGGVAPTILGEFFINFGYIGIFIGMLLLGVICKLIDNNALKSNWNKILYTIIIFFIARTVGSGISNFIILGTWFFIVSLVILKLDIDVLRKIFMRIFSKTIMKYIKARDTVLIANGLNGFNGNPKEIFLKSQEDNIKKRYYWITKDKELYTKLKKEYQNILYAYSLKGIIYIIKSKYYVISVNTQDIYPGLKIPNNRIVIQTFHGFPAKTICKAASTYYSDKEIEKQMEDTYNSNNMYILTGGKYEDKIYFENADFPYERMLRVGHPRNDKLLNHKKIGEEKKNKIVADKNQKIVCYCPTWRENDNFKLFPFKDSNLEEFNEFLKKNNILLIIKLHPLYGRMDENIDKYTNICLYSKEWNLDNLELFSIIDLLITDYSSIYCDYLLTNKPVAFIQYDYEEYIKTRPLNNKREVLFPGPFINNFEEFRNEIIKLIQYENYYDTERKKALKLFYEYYNFDAADKVIKFIEGENK